MRVTAEIFPLRLEKEVELDPNGRGLDLLRALGLSPEAHILVRGETPIPSDDPLADGDRVRVIGVVSGGGSS